VTDVVSIPARFNGPPASANGGYSCGLVAAAIGPSANVRLRLPPPLDAPMLRRRDPDGVVRLLHGDAVVAEGRAAHPAVEPPAVPTPAVARQAARAYPADAHPYPTCFVCGSERAADGLGVFPGPTGVEGMVAAPWRPGEEFADDGVVDPVFVWSALDCPSGFACIPTASLTLLASMTAACEAPVHPGRQYVVAAWPVSSDGRKHRGGSALYDSDGRRVALAETLWITVRR
jgi:hypothetical protein